MTHYSYDRWFRYVQGRLPENERRRMEDHLAECDACLQAYVLVSESVYETQLSPDFTRSVMDKVRGREELSKRVTATSLRRPVFLNYAIAACLTLLLTFGGVFNTVSTVMAKPEVVGQRMEQVSQIVGDRCWSQAHKAFSIFERIKLD